MKSGRKSQRVTTNGDEDKAEERKAWNRHSLSLMRRMIFAGIVAVRQVLLCLAIIPLPGDGKPSER